jgi:hypothetical protein
MGVEQDHSALLDLLLSLSQGEGRRSLQERATPKHNHMTTGRVIKIEKFLEAKCHLHIELR